MTDKLDTQPALTVLHLIPYLRWEREGRATFEIQRARLLDVLAWCVYRLQKDKTTAQHILLGGQTVILEDAADVRPDLVTALVMYNGEKKLEVGPWYVQVDDALVSGESLIHNLLLARIDADHHGISLSRIAYTPEVGGHTGQLPQILRGFGINGAFLHHGAPVVHLPFRWEAPDGSSILVVSHENLSASAVLSIKKQQVIKPDGPFLWMIELPTERLDVPESVTLPVERSTLGDHVSLLRQAMPDQNRPALRGELRMQMARTGGFLLPGSLSARLYLKQKNAALQNLLTFAAEPFMALALSHGRVEYPDNARALLDHSWRTLIKNQSYPALGGHAIDAVHDENEVRFRQVEDLTQQVIERALNGLPGKRHQRGSISAQQRLTYAVVWNAHNWRVKQVVELQLDLPARMHPAHVIASNGDEQVFGWNPATMTLSFVADVPPVGYNTYTIDLDDKLPPQTNIIQTSNASSIADSTGATLTASDGFVTWRRKESVIFDLMRLYSGGDAGDTYNYCPPDDDVIEQGLLTGGVQVESSPVYERLILRHRMRVAPSLNANRQRERGVRLLEFVTTATYYDEMPGVYFNTSFTNTAQDHRVRVHLRTGIQSQTVLSDSAFAIDERAITPEGSPFATRPNTEGVIGTYPMVNVCALENSSTAMGLLGRGLPEFEAIQEDKQTTLALTLLRAVGWISRDDLKTRTASIGAVTVAPGAQCERLMQSEYALVPLPVGDRAAMFRQGQSFNAPLRAYQYSEPPEKRQRSYLSVMTNLGVAGESDGNGAILTAFKPPHNGRGWLVRLFNPTDRKVEAQVVPHAKTRYARITNLAEEPQTILEPDANGVVVVNIPPHKIVSLRLGFN